MNDIRPVRSRGRSAGAELAAALRGVAEVVAPDAAEEPILTPATRGAMFEWLAELRAADELTAAGLTPRSTALMFGPPGCGKTTLAHHIAARLGVPMVVVGAESLFAAHMGEGEKNVARLFDGLEAAEVPCLVFLDEIEAIGARRQAGTGGGATHARGSMLTVMLRRIERFRGMLVGATNRHDALDPALWRRFHLQVEVGLPGDEERFAILRRYGAPFVFPDDDLDLLSDLTVGASPALLRGVMEGVKRALVLAPKLGREVGSALDVLRRVTASVSPPPEITGVPLWTAAIGEVASMTWPPTREMQ